MGTIEFNSATYYRYASLDLGQLTENFKSENVANAVAAFVRALFIAVPAARQATMAAACPWDFACIVLRKGQRLQMPFSSAVKTSKEHPDLVSASKAALLEQLAAKKKMFGSMYGKLAEFTIGMDTQTSIDDVLEGLQQNIEKI
jgi:CRISPR system Cascade subunit CasC